MSNSRHKKINRSLTIEDLHEHFDVNFELGKLYWKKVAYNKKQLLGREIGSPHHGYLKVQFKGGTYLVHRFILAIYLGYWPDVVDHINGIKDDNRIVNLRNTDQIGNSRNRNCHREGLVTLGCYKRPKAGKTPWIARAVENGKKKTLGYFNTKEEASAFHTSYTTGNFYDI